jgi:hypothetical protein
MEASLLAGAPIDVGRRLFHCANLGKNPRGKSIAN